MLRKRSLISLLVLAALLFTAACQPITAQSQPMAPATDEDVVAAVNAIWDEYEASVIAGDVDRWIAQWTEDGVQMPPGEPLVEGKENIYTRVGANMAAGPTTDFVITPLETTSAGDWAYSRGVYTVTFPLGDSGEEGMIDGKFMTILQRQPDGTWKIHRDIFNSNVPPAAPQSEAVTPSSDEDAVAAIQAVWEEYSASVLAGDPARRLKLWAEDGIQMPPDRAARVGKETIQAAIEAGWPRWVVNEYVVNPEEIEVFGDTAYARGTYYADRTPVEGGDPVVTDGKFMTILKRQEDGSWRIYRDIFNSNVPPAPVAAPPTDVDAVTEAVNAIWAEYEASLSAGDVDRWVDLWTDEGIQLPPGEPPVMGKEAIRARNKAALTDLFDISMSITNDEVVVGGDWAVARGLYTATLTPKAGGDDVLIDGKYMTLLQQQEDGSWKIYRDIFNSNVSP